MFDMGITATESRVMKSEWQDNLVRYLGRANVLLKLYDCIPEPEVGVTGDRTVVRTSCTIDTALLRACWLIYLESRFIPVHNCIHDFYGHRWNRFGGVSICSGFTVPAPMSR